jgi:YHS domain-containing protein
MARALLLLVLVIFLARAFWRVVDGIVEGARGTGPASPGSRAPQPSVHMVRDPVCGTFLVPERAISIASGGDPVYFCSARCRDQYQGRAERRA